MASKILTEASVLPSPSRLGHLPAPGDDAIAHMHRVHDVVAKQIDTCGFLPFDRYMEIVLHAPGLGYYSAGATKFGPSGDFVTAPEMSPLFGASVAQQLAELIEAGCTRIVELGAGTGRMATDILRELERIDRLPDTYEIVELSADLKARQSASLQHHIPHLSPRLRWHDTLPDLQDAIVLGNEVLDALPVSLVRVDGSTIEELGVTLTPDRRGFAWSNRPATGELARQTRSLDLPDGYTTEIHLSAHGLVRTLADKLTRGVALFIDYGFPVSEYYHAQRSGGTLMCHYRHHAHTDPLCLPGLQDITAHIDFSTLARVATQHGLDVLGYTQQARFLMNCGLLDLLAAYDPNDVARYAPACAAAQKLLSPAEMGELFKVIAFGRGIDAPLLGFRSGDRSGLL